MKNNTKISVINFAQEAVKYFFNPNEKYHKWGVNNSEPFKILELYNSIPEHTSSIDFTEALLVGEGISTDKISYWDIKKITLDYLLFGGFTSQVIKTRGGGFTINYVDISKCRLSANEKQIAYSDNWDSYKPEIKWIDITTDITKEGIFIFKNNKSRGLYPRPYYLSVSTSLDTMKGIIDYHNNNAKNGFTPNVVINFNNGIPDDETQAKIEKSITNKFTGSVGQKFILSFNESETTKTTIEKLDNDNLDQRFKDLQLFIQNQIIVSHKITSGTLIGIKPENQGFSKTEYYESLEVFKDIVINNYRNEIEYALTNLLKEEVKFIDKSIIQAQPEINIKETEVING